MDYGFAPGTSGFDGLVRRMFNRRASTTLISARRGRTTTRDFIQHLNGSSSITKPIDNLLLGSHANSQGYLFTPMFREQRGPTSYEVLEDSLTTSSRSIAVPDSLIGFVPGNPVNKSFHIKGCNIGKATPFLTKMKQALGGNIRVTAPKHFHGIYYRSSHGTWELMAYEFRLLNRIAFANRTDLLAALAAKNFTFYDGNPITPPDWDQWVPTQINRPSSVTLNIPLGTTLARRSTIPFRREFRYRRNRYTFTITYGNASQVPSGDAARMSDLQTALTNFKYRTTDTVGAFDAAHPYPEYDRWGYVSFQQFMNEHDWRFSKSGRTLVCHGYFHSYTLMIPITDRVPANNNRLVFNFYPKSGSSLTHITNLAESDTAFFATI